MYVLDNHNARTILLDQPCSYSEWDSHPHEIFDTKIGGEIEQVIPRHSKSEDDIP